MNKRGLGVEIAGQLLLRPSGATMDEIIAVTGGPQYNVLRKLAAKGFKVRKVKEGRATRYFAEEPAARVYEASLTRQGQVTIPKEVRERLRLREGQKLRFSLEASGRATIEPASPALSDLFGILGKPPRSATLEDMDKAIQRAAVERYLRSSR